MGRIALAAIMVLVGCATGGDDLPAVDGAANSADGRSSDATSNDADATNDASAVCTDTWRIVRPNFTAADILVSADTLLLGGTDSTGGVISEVSMCNGASGASVSFMGGGSVEALAQTSLGVFAVGAVVGSGDPQHGVYARLSTAPLSVDLETALFGSAGTDTATGLVEAGGAIWMTGIVDVGGTPGLWGIKADAAGAACGFGGPSGATAGRAIAAIGSDVYMIGDDAGHGLVAHYDGTSCSIVGPCPCAADWTVPIQVGSESTQVLAAVVGSGSLYAAGIARNTGAVAGDFFGFVVQLQLGTGAEVGRYTWDLTLLAEGFTSLTVTTNALYVVGGASWDGGAQFEVSNATLQALPLNLSGSPTATWIAAPDANVLWAIRAGASDGLYVAGAGSTQTEAVVMRCTNAGNCAP